MQYTGQNHDVGEMRCISADLDDGILTVALNRPEQRNLLDVAMTLEMVSLLQAVHFDTQVRVVVLRGAGAGFCAGLDIADFQDAGRHGEAALRAARDAANDWRARRLRLLPQPVLAMVHGFCEGGALAILAGCDIVLAAEDAHFALSAADAGALTEGPLARSLCGVMLPRAASYHALTGAAFDGREAERNGLATHSLPAAELEAQTYALARELAAKDEIALRLTKETLLHVADMSWDGALSFTAAKFAELKALQAGRQSPRAGAIESFLAGKTKPGLGG
ncbi:p-hydroxycinnamoyl CoA hydratase/lyase [Verticiella sediminum]|uniref:p-hydroxycinnamoyl CoA hydratase/lyase n=1 Tax=Verticiella sediminum TaxID=1247510 RepID=A0A556ABD3_9BURK|nr:enoyl-CoA hydratase-related protein [Verticiella sediminum]TSH90180.1 p-hydroxycinnamoyl CoA hydratase/lyase [Verticiella sediminum]